MIASLLLTTTGLILFFAPHHAKGEIFRRRTLAAHVGEMFHAPPRKVEGVVLMAIGLAVFLSVFYPALGVCLMRFAPAGMQVLILIAAAVACGLAAVATPVLMVFIFTPIGFGTPREAAPRTFIFYAIPAYLGLAAVWFVVAAFVPGWRVLP